MRSSESSSTQQNATFLPKIGYSGFCRAGRILQSARCSSYEKRGACTAPANPPPERASKGHAPSKFLIALPNFLVCPLAHNMASWVLYGMDGIPAHAAFPQSLAFRRPRVDFRVEVRWLPLARCHPERSLSTHLSQRSPLQLVHRPSESIDFAL